MASDNNREEIGTNKNSNETNIIIKIFYFINLVFVLINFSVLI